MGESPSSGTPYLIVGLGNPGRRYAATRHNAGFMVVDEMARRYGLRFATRQANAEVARGEVAGVKVILAKPQTYMNNSGQAVRALAHFYKIPNERILIIYDEIALPLGTIRIREKGSSAGHNGVKSVIQHMGTESIPRMRVGVDRPSDPRHNQIDWVLGHFTKEESATLQETLGRAVAALESIFKIGIERTMNFYNINPTPPPAEQGSRTAPTGTSTAREEGAGAARKDELSLQTLRERAARIQKSAAGRPAEANEAKDELRQP